MSSFMRPFSRSSSKRDANDVFKEIALKIGKLDKEAVNIVWYNEWKALKTLSQLQKKKASKLILRRRNVSRNPVGFDDILKEVFYDLKGNESSIIGILGAAGIGKTTVVEKLKTLAFNSIFTKLIVIPQTSMNRQESMTPLQIYIIQEIIARALGIPVEGHTGELTDVHKVIYKRADQLRWALSKENFLIMIDDVWKKFPFSDIGIDIYGLNKNSRSKILFTTRLRKTCEDIGAHKVVEMKHLDADHSLMLLTDISPASNIDFGSITKKCRGLPAALSTVGMASKKLELDKIKYYLNNSPSTIPGMKERVLEVIKSSFDRLPDIVHKSCFLLCTLFPDFEDINKQNLVNYWIGEGLVPCDDKEDLKMNRTIISKRKKGTMIIKALLDACLLEKGQDEEHVRVHDVVHMVAGWIATGGGGFKHNLRYLAGESFRDKLQNCNKNGSLRSLVKKMKGCKRVSLNDLHGEILGVVERAPFPHLQTLLMGLYDRQLESQAQVLQFYQSYSVRQNMPTTAQPSCREHYIPSHYFNRMPNLCVLDMTGRPFQHLPRSLCHLKLLRFLNLSWTFIEEIPPEFSGLKELEQLDLTGTIFLSSIPKEAIICLRKLRSFKLRSSGYSRMDSEGQIGLICLEELKLLEEIELPLQNLEAMQKLVESEILSPCVRYLQLAFIPVLGAVELYKFLSRVTNLQVLSISSCSFEKGGTIDMDVHDNLDFLETLTLREVVGVRNMFIDSVAFIGKIFMSQIRKLQISFCGDLVDATFICQLPSLEILDMEQCEKIIKLLQLPQETTTPSRAEIIEAASTTSRENLNHLSKLKSLRLDNLPELTTISNCNLSFESLENIIVYRCPNLQHLPISFLDGRSKVRIVCQEEWWKGLQEKFPEEKVSFFGQEGAFKKNHLI